MPEWKTIDSLQIVSNPWIQIFKEQYLTESNIKVADYYILAKKDYSVIIAVNNGNIILLDQYRPGLKKRVLNLPMGLIEPGEDPKTAALRELKEETGFKSKSLVFLGKFALAPSFCTFHAHIFFSEDLDFDGGINPDESEGGSRIVEIPFKDITKAVLGGQIIDMSSVLAISLLKNRKPSLF